MLDVRKHHRFRLDLILYGIVCSQLFTVPSGLPGCSNQALGGVIRCAHVLLVSVFQPSKRSVLSMSRHMFSGCVQKLLVLS
jgi:hypothetical protein